MYGSVDTKFSCGTSKPILEIYFSVFFVYLLLCILLAMKHLICLYENGQLKLNTSFWSIDNKEATKLLIFLY